MLIKFSILFLVQNRATALTFAISPTSLTVCLYPLISTSLSTQKAKSSRLEADPCQAYVNPRVLADRSEFPHELSGNSKADPEIAMACMFAQKTPFSMHQTRKIANQGKAQSRRKLPPGKPNNLGPTSDFKQNEEKTSALRRTLDQKRISRVSIILEPVKDPS
ncbi:hypothetical protein V1509DRAFT_616258 [Lipomyces kononenkoae]